MVLKFEGTAMEALPKIRTYIEAVGRTGRYAFQQPTPERGLRLLHVGDSERSLKAQILFVAKFSLIPLTAIPFHVYTRREAHYTLWSGSEMTVVIARNELFQTETIANEETLLIPPGCPHAILYNFGHVGVCQIILSSQEDDTVWEEETQWLLTERRDSRLPVMSGE